MENLTNLKQQLETLLQDLQRASSLQSGQILVVGCSTSEVIGEKIGTAGTEQVAATIFETLANFHKQTGVELAFQCCEHLNRALVINRKTAIEKGYDLVSVIPVAKAGGAMATYAFAHLEDPVMIEFIKADAGIDIGDTFIGMHLKHVAVPVRSTVKQVGQAHVTMAFTRPKLIGGERAVYNQSMGNESCR